MGKGKMIQQRRNTPVSCFTKCFRSRAEDVLRRTAQFRLQGRGAPGYAPSARLRLKTGVWNLAAILVIWMES